MQGSLIRDQVWISLRNTLKSFSMDKKSLAPSQLERITKQLLKYESESEVNYLVRNLNRIDKDNNGQIDFDQFANFLLKRHCGEMALQRMHRQKIIAHHGSHKIQPDEFCALLNEAYRFLKVNVDQRAAHQIFTKLDSNRDGLITYVEYFQYIETQMCQNDKRPAPVVPQVLPESEKSILIRFRRFLWGELLKIYIKYDKDGNGDLDDNELILLLKELLGEVSQSRLDYVFKNAFRMDMNNDTSFTFEEFAVFFIKHSCELALDRFNRERQTSGRRDINSQDFLYLFRNSFSFISNRLNDTVIKSILTLIDTDLDGIISYQSYLQWITELVKYRNRYGMPIYLEEDNFEDFFIVVPDLPIYKPVPEPSVVVIPQPNRNPGKSRWYFSSIILSDKVKEHTLKLLLSFDKNRNREVDESKVEDILRTLLKEDKNQILYVTKNFLRYKLYKNKPVTFEDFVQFFLGLHCGEMAIQRLHRESFYSRGRERQMNETEFVRTLHSAFSYINYSAIASEIKQLYLDIDSTRVGWISYQNYFGALKEYFRYLQPSNIRIFYHYPETSSLSGTPAISPLPSSRYELEDLTTEEIVGDMIRSKTLALIATFDDAKNMYFETHEIVRLMKQVFHEAAHEIEYVTKNMFRYDPDNDGMVQYDELANFILEIHCGEIALQRLHREKRIPKWEERLLNIQDFFAVMEEAFSFLDVTFKKDDLTIIFNHLDSGRSGHIGYGKYFGYIRDSMGSKRRVRTQTMKSSRTIATAGSSNNIYTYSQGIPSHVPGLSGIVNNSSSPSAIQRFSSYATPVGQSRNSSFKIS